MKDPVENELQRQAPVIERVLFVGELQSAIMKEITKESEPFGPKPEWCGKKEGETGAVAEQCQLIKLSRPSQLPVFLSTRGFVEELLGEDVLSDEDDSATKGAKDAEKIPRKLHGTGQDYAKCKRYQGEVGCGRVMDVEYESVSKDGEEGRETFDGMDK